MISIDKPEILPDRKPADRIAQILSLLLHPLLLPTLGTWLLFWVAPGAAMYSFKLKYVILLIVFASSFLLPLLFFGLLKLNSGSKFFGLSPRYARTLPYVFTAFSLYLGLQIITRIPISAFFRLFLLGCFILLILLFVVKTFWNISEHTVGFGAMLGAFLGLALRFALPVQGVLEVLLVLAGLVGTVQLFRDSHSPKELYFGYLFGFAILYLTIRLI